MKKIVVLPLLLSLSVFLIIKNSFANVIPPRQRVIEKCVKINNLNLFSNISLIVLEKRVIEGNDRIYEIVDNQCLKREYKANQLKIYWNFKGNLKIEEDKLLVDNVEMFYETVEESNPLVGEEAIYSLTKDFQGKIRLYKSREIKKYGNGEVKTKDFKNPYETTISPTLSTNISQQESVAPTKAPSYSNKEKSFLEIIFCWLKRLFGVNCD